MKIVLRNFSHCQVDMYGIFHVVPCRDLCFIAITSNGSSWVLSLNHHLSYCLSFFIFKIIISQIKRLIILHCWQQSLKYFMWLLVWAFLVSLVSVQVECSTRSMIRPMRLIGICIPLVYSECCQPSWPSFRSQSVWNCSAVSQHHGKHFDKLVWLISGHMSHTYFIELTFYFRWWRADFHFLWFFVISWSDYPRLKCSHQLNDIQFKTNSLLQKYYNLTFDMAIKNSSKYLRSKSAYMRFPHSNSKFYLLYIVVILLLCRKIRKYLWRWS